MEQRVKTLENLLAQKAAPGHNSQSWRPGSCLDSPLQDSPMALTTETPPSASNCDVSLNLSCSLGAFPASSITDQPVSDTGQSPNTKLDLIARGLLSEEVARELFDFYHEHLDRHIYHLLARSGSLAEVRSRSSLLTAAICTVAALASASSQYDNCLKAFTAEVAGELFSKDHTFDDIRALCIGSFWLGDISVALCALGRSPRTPLLHPVRTHLTPSISGPLRLRAQPPPLHHQDAAHQMEMLRANAPILPRLHLRPPQLPQARPPTHDARHALPPEPARSPARRVLRPL